MKIEMVEAIAMAGYRSPALVEEALATFQADDRQRQWHRAILALGHLRAPSALAALESAARTGGERQQHAIQGIIAYGSESGHAMEILKKLANDPALQQNHRNFAELGIKRLSETAPPPRLLIMRLTFGRGEAEMTQRLRSLSTEFLQPTRHRSLAGLLSPPARRRLPI